MSQMIRSLLDLDGSQPVKLLVRKTSPPEQATPTYSVIGDYEWAERVLSAGSYARDAHALALALGDALGIAVDVRGLPD